MGPVVNVGAIAAQVAVQALLSTVVGEGIKQIIMLQDKRAAAKKGQNTNAKK